jgi:hypothetical protein
MSEARYPWYETVSGSILDQGDIIEKCPVLIPVNPDDIDEVASEATPDAEVLVARMVVLTQACDLEHAKVESVVLCPAWTLEELGEQVPDLKHKKQMEKLRTGERPAYHMLAAYPDLGQPVLVVDFHRLFTTPKGFLTKLANRRGNRARLLPPYREHLSQSFARYFMRVGLPVDIPPFR